MENEKRKDPQTGEIFVPKRSNQLYARRANQIKFNNEKQKRERKENLVVNRYLLRNKKILRYCLGTNKEVIRSHEFLLGAGFKFEHYTHYFRDGSKWAYCVYKYCYVATENNNYKIFTNV
jgi:hypothetical protein